MSKITNKGFTLIELLVVIAVLGVLAGGVLATINPLKRINQANDVRIQSDIGQIVQALQAYYTANRGVYPATLAALTTTQDIKVIPVPPGGVGTYTYAVGTGNAEAAVSFRFQDQPTSGTLLWCWRSVTGQLTSAGTTCNP